MYIFAHLDRYVQIHIVKIKKKLSASTNYKLTFQWHKTVNHNNQYHFTAQKEKKNNFKNGMRTLRVPADQCQVRGPDSLFK